MAMTFDYGNLTWAKLRETHERLLRDYYRTTVPSYIVPMGGGLNLKPGSTLKVKDWTSPFFEWTQTRKEKPVEKDIFFYVFNPVGSKPSFKHLSRAEAETEAKRLARINPGQEFFVLQSVSSFKAVDVVETRYTNIPF
jgi:hypothetical protein